MMFSTKKNVLQTVALLKAYDISHIVISPGSRNAPLIQSFASDPFFICHSIVDERSAGFFAIGLINRLIEPVALCCTSGTALLNYGPAVAEAHYQEIPLVVISADRPAAWIGQMDGQTLPQPGVFGSLVRKSVQIPEINCDEDLWYCNRLLNEVLIACTHRGCGPVHINVPISEPLFDFSETSLPEVRRIFDVSCFSDTHVAGMMDDFVSLWKNSCKRMIITGQANPFNGNLDYLMEEFLSRNECVVLTEHLSNTNLSMSIRNFDALIFTLGDEERRTFAPDLLITIGGHVVSKRVKKFLRKYPPKFHWHFSPSGNMPDSFQCLTHLIDADPVEFFKHFRSLVCKLESKGNDYAMKWISASESLPLPGKDLPFSDITVTGAFMRQIPDNVTLFVGNSSSVRNIQLFPLHNSINVFCNRGTNGIEGSVSTAIGYASGYEGHTFILVGDLSFFYDINSLWNNRIPANLHILLINNGGGGIFHLLPGLEKAESLEEFVVAGHSSNAEGWVKAADMDYLRADSENSLESALQEFVKTNREKAIVLEVFTTTENNKIASDNYYQQIKKQ